MCILVFVYLLRIVFRRHYFIYIYLCNPFQNEYIYDDAQNEKTSSEIM